MCGLGFVGWPFRIYWTKDRIDCPIEYRVSVQTDDYMYIVYIYLDIDNVTDMSECYPARFLQLRLCSPRMDGRIDYYGKSLSCSPEEREDKNISFLERVSECLGVSCHGI